MLEEGVDFVGYYQLFGLIEQLGWIKHWNKELNGYMHLCPECQLAHIERFKKIKEKAEREMYSIAEAPDQLSPTK